MPYIQSKILPLVLSGSILILAAAGLWKDTRRKDMAATAVPDVEKGNELKLNWQGYLGVVGWTAGFSLSIFLLGFLVSMPVYIFLYMKTHNISWFISTLSATLATAIVFLGFQTLLRVELYPGLLFTWLNPLIYHR